jgi:hypothetical protein
LRALPAAKTCQKFSGKTEAKQDEKRNALPAPGSKNMLYKVTSR